MSIVIARFGYILTYFAYICAEQSKRDASVSDYFRPVIIGSRNGLTVDQ